VLLNAGTAIYVAGLQANIHGGIMHAAKVIDSGEALAKLNALKAITNKEMPNKELQ
jgi:anthranilate phosphoribosyltransferase